MNMKINLFLLSLCLAFSQIQGMETGKEKETYERHGGEEMEREETVRGNISLTPSAMGLVLTSMTPDSSITVASAPTAFLKSGSGFSIGAVAGAGFSSGIVGQTIGGAGKYHFIVNLQIPVLFVYPFSSVPVNFVSIEQSGHAGTFVDANTATTLQVSTSNVTTSGVVINITFNIIAEGATYLHALANGQTAIDRIVTDQLAVNILAIE